MEYLEGDSGRERHFVLHVMSFVYGLGLRPLQPYLQKMLDRYPREYESFCTKNITRALLIYISDYMESKQPLVELTSQAYLDQIEDLTDDYNHYDFLRLLALYSFKSRSEYYVKNLPDSPIRFYSSMVGFLEEMKENNRCGAEFWEDLDKAAAEVVTKGLEAREGDAAISDDETGTSEREFVLMLMNVVSNLYSNPLPDYLRRELDEFMLTSVNDFPPNFENALTIATDNLERNVYVFSGDDEPIYNFYYRLATRSFSARYFLEFLLCCTRRALLEYYVKSKKQSPSVAFDRLCLILQNAKQEGKFHSVDDLIKGANEIIADEKMRLEAKAAISNAPTEFFSDNSTESTGARESMFKSFELSLPTIDSEKADVKNPQSILSFVVPSTSNDQSKIDNVKSSTNNSPSTIGSILLSIINALPSSDSAIVPATDGQPYIKRETTPGQNVQTDTNEIVPVEGLSSIENVMAYSEHGQPFNESAIASSENGRPSIEKVITASENGRPSFEKVVTSSENSQPSIDKVITSSENSQLFEKVTASGENNQPATEKAATFDNAEDDDIEILISSSEKASNERPCKCCSVL